MIQYECIDTENNRIEFNGNILPKQLSCGDMFKNKGNLYMLKYRSFIQSDEDLVICRLVAKKINDYGEDYEDYS